ncbi:MAG: alkaline phosphatase [Sphingobacteriales bacterium]|nr:MAG: alkaline phosphatase [Sphingobacteriales bacterium]
MIGDGMGLSQITAGMIRNKGTLNLEKFPYCGFIKTWSADNLVTDSGAGATAFSIGQKTKNGAIGVDANGKSMKTLLEYAEEKQMKTGMVVTSAITHATPASFAAHNISRNNQEEIALDIFSHDIEVLIGGGKKFFDKRTDKRNLLTEYQVRGYEVEDKLKKVGKLRGEKVLALVADDHLYRAGIRKDYLQRAAANAIQLLTGSGMGYFLMIEGSQIDFGGHENNEDYQTEEMVDFDKTIGDILNLVGRDPETLIIVLADHETGGFSITGGNLAAGKVESSYTTKNHTASLIPVFANGPGAEVFSGIYDNTDIFTKILTFIQDRP